MSRRIFTEEQYKFIEENKKESDNINMLLEQMRCMQSNGKSDISTIKLISFLNYRQQIISNNLNPFIKRNNIYKKKVAEIVKSHGFGPQDVYDEATISEIVELQHRMLEEVSNLTPDLCSKKITDKEKRNIFQDSQYRKQNNTEQLR